MIDTGTEFNSVPVTTWNISIDTALKLCNNLMLTKKIKKEKLIYRKITERT